MNKVTLIGRLTNEVDVRFYGKGKDKGTYASFCVACPRPKKDEEKTDFIYCTAFGKVADFLEEFSKKGGRIAIDGTLQQSTYTNKDGEQRTSYQVLANRVEIIDWADKND